MKCNHPIRKVPTTKEHAMPVTDHARCRFTITPNVDGEPAMLHIEFFDKTLSALERPTKRVFFGLRKGVAWEDAEALAGQLNKTVETMSLTEYAAGE
jgi:hypothetical protein